MLPGHRSRAGCEHNEGMSTAFYTHPDCLRHDMGPGHPECPERLSAIGDHLRATGLDMALDHFDAPLADLECLQRAHSAAYVAELDSALQTVASDGGLRALDPDTSANAFTRAAAFRAAGAAVAATDAVIDGRVHNAFCAVRPPGHHATRTQTMGFCFFNNVAVAARHALDVRGLKRVAIIDFDVHHGNGTEDIVAGDGRILMCSFFQHPLYPYSGVEPLGDNMVNIGLPRGSSGEAMREAVESHWLPALDEFKPEIIYVSAGFDAHRADELAGLAWVEDDYAWVTEKILDVADRHAKGRVISLLEGGYALQALARSVGAHVRGLISH